MTNKWYLDETTMTIRRIEDNIRILEMCIAVEGEKGLNRNDAIDLANQIIEDWNFSCEELE